MKRIVLIIIAISLAVTSLAGLSNEMYKVFRQGKPLIIDQDRAIINGRLETGRTAELTTVYLTEDLLRRSVQATVRVTASGPSGRSSFSSGSGVNIDPNGLIITGAHVVQNSDMQNAENITITFFTGRKYAARIKEISSEKDLAVLELLKQNNTLPAIELGDSLGVMEGDKITVIGFPLGDFSVMSGTVTRLNVRSARLSIPLIQINANTNKGNSGGPVLNESGKVIGIVVGTFDPADESQRNFLGAVVPINEVKPYLVERWDARGER